MGRIRQPAVAGSFYPGHPEMLAREINGMLREARRNNATPSPTMPKALIVPHAGYVYSGPIAASAYASLPKTRNSIRRVVLLGPAHRVPVRGLALPGADAFATPLGIVPVDLEVAANLARLPNVAENTPAHAWEHSLEVQLPFLQQVLGNFTVVPLVVGDAAPEVVADVLDVAWGGTETLIVISSDLSHYLAYEEAEKIDRDTAQMILALKYPLPREQACGAAPVNGLLLAARRHHLKPVLLDLRNSGDTAGDHQQVVGYAAFSFMEGLPDAR